MSDTRAWDHEALHPSEHQAEGFSRSMEERRGRKRKRETWSEGQQSRQAGREGGRRGQEGGEKVRKVLDKGRMSKEQWEAQEVCPRRRGVSRRGQL